MAESFPTIPNAHALFAMLITAFALFLFTRKNLPLEISSLGLLGILAVVFSLFPYEHDGETFEAIDFFLGFGHEALIAVCALMVIGQGLVTTGALEPVGRLLTRAWAISPFLSLLATLVISAVLSAFINNTPIVVLLLPILISVCLRTKSPASKVLMPMGFATLVGGMSTTIGTSTNLLVVSVASELGQPRLQMFDFVVPAAIASGVAITYLWLLAPRMLPKREIDLADSSPRLFQARLHLDESSPCIGKSVAETKKLAGNDINLVRINRGDHQIYPLPDAKLQAGDRLRVMDTAKKIRDAATALKATLYSGDTRVDDEHPLRAENQTVAEIAVVSGSSLDRANLRFSGFLHFHQLFVLALHRAGKDIWKPGEEIMDVILEQGDVLLVQGSKEEIKKLKRSTEFLVLDASEEVPSTKRAPLALAILLTVVVTAAFGLLPIAVSSLAGAIVMVATRSLNLGTAIRAVSSSVFFVVVASLALGQALLLTGASDYMTEVFLYFTRDAAPSTVLSALILLIAIFTNIVSNNAAAVIGTPIGIGIAEQLGVSPEPFVLAVLFGANLSYATPMSYKTNLLVMSAGNYTFNDFLKVGLPLTIIMWLTYSWILSSLYL
ncbi:MAG: SLC13 family permease [Gammaproteobacteria bacterium]|nr:SLC13 family permease [Pseudomonadales bacterium]MCP5345480.1 SLC13 family permease [Pseudomonadales bacterium]